MLPILSLSKNFQIFYSFFSFFFLNFPQSSQNSPRDEFNPFYPQSSVSLPPISSFSLSLSIFFFFFLFSLAVETMIYRRPHIAGVHTPTHQPPTVVEDSCLVAAPSDMPWWWGVSHSKPWPSRVIFRQSWPPLWSMWAFLESLFQALSSSTHFTKRKSLKNWHAFSVIRTKRGLILR